ncbi:MAG: adenosylcobalamin-dependent ribonucleoside-diphosphate reductase [Akkermansia sp.]|nr:adenosylcobalamin-dependent ribonucleoside-diphosphate reductase [Akkermansia sp.]
MSTKPDTSPDNSTARAAEAQTVLSLRDGHTLLLPTRKSLIGGLAFKRRFSSLTAHPYNQINWGRRDIRLTDWKTGKLIYERLGIEAPAHWDENAVRITADKYLFGSEPGTPEYEDSFRQIFDRIANTYTVWGWEEGYFASLEDAHIFNEEIKAMLVRQIWAPNSPVWFNIGHWEQWRWGRPDLRGIFTGNGNIAYHTKGGPGSLQTHTVASTYEYPQCSACFLTEVKDEMESILTHLLTEGRVFASGSGVGINISSLRSSKEPIRGKGHSSGPISFDRGWDRMAGAIRSGGKTRRAARMVLMFSDHPDIFDFIKVKNRQEDIAKVILREHNVHLELRALAEARLAAGTPAERAAARVILALPLATETHFDPHMDALLYGETLSNQNANHSVSLKGDFWQALADNGNTYTRWITNPSHIDRTFRAAELLEQMADSIWDNGEPGVHNNDVINLWNPVKSLGTITTSNPCSEYVFLNNTSCNLSSFNAYRFLKKQGEAPAEFDADALQDAARLAMVCADLNIERGGFPIPEIAEGTYRFRTTGIGFANVGGALMSLGVPYDSDEGRWIASQLCSMLTASCWAASAEMGRELGPYPEYENTKSDLKAVIRLHQAAEKLAFLLGEGKMPGDDPEKAADAILAGVEGELPEAQGLDARYALLSFLRSFETPSALNPQRIAPAGGLARRALELWTQAVKNGVFRNSFVSVMAPTGTISAPLGCYDEGTTSIEPDYTLVKWKQLAGGGAIKMFNRLSLEALRTLGYSEQQVREAAFEVAGLDGLVTACGGRMDEAVSQLLSDPCAGTAGPVRHAWRRTVRPEDGRQEIQETIARLTNAANAAAFTADQLTVVNGMSHMENIPWLRAADLAVFDCSATNGNGVRSIAPAGHLRMLGALQPFISGACSKTVNLPVAATRKDIYDSLVMSHHLGVKCIALFRAGSKANAVYVVDTPETRRFKAGHIWSQLVESGQEAIDEIIAAASKPRQRKLPGRRLGQTVKFSVGGQLTGYLTVGVYTDGTCGEVFGRLGQVGSFASGMFEAYCKLLSTALQFGVPLKEVVKGFRNYSFEPSGFCRVGDDNDGDTCTEIRSCASVVDLIAKILAWLFPEGNGYRLRDVFDVSLQCALSGGGKAELQVLPPRLLPASAGASRAPSPEPAAPEKADGGLNGASICPQCHSLAYVQDGKCKSCRNCGYKDGGCGE